LIVDKNLEFFAHPLHPSRPRLDALFLSHQSRSTKMPTHVRTPPAPFSRFPSPRATSRASRLVVSPFPANAARGDVDLAACRRRGRRLRDDGDDDDDAHRSPRALTRDARVLGARAARPRAATTRASPRRRRARAASARANLGFPSSAR
jgi:hypothetical protein